MSIWLWFVLGVIAGMAPALLARKRFKPWLTRRWWRLSLGIALVCLVLPFGLVLIMFISDSAYDAIREMGNFLWGDEFNWATGLTLGWLTGSFLMARAYRKSPPLEGPPLSAQVIALARNPETKWQAIERYRQESDVNIAVASDVVEAYVDSHRRRPRPAAETRPKSGWLEWMYVGFGTAWYVVFVIGYVLTFRSQSNHFITALAFFLFIPGLFGGFCGMCGEVMSPRSRAALQERFRSGLLTCRSAFIAGMVAGVASMAGVMAIGFAAYSVSHDEIAVVIAFVGIAAVLTVAPFLGFYLLHTRCFLPQQKV